MSEAAAIGVDLGGTRVKLVALDEDGEVLAARERPTADDANDWAPGIRAELEELALDAPGPLPLGLCAPGLAAPDGRSIAHMPGRLAGLEGLDWSAALAWPRPVPVMNDAHAALVGEAWRGAARGLENAVLLTLGTGVGGAALVDGRLLRGHIGRAGHFGHVCLDAHGEPDVCGTPGSLEGAIGECTLARRTGGAFGTTSALLAALAEGDPFARETWERSLRALAVAIASLVNALDPAAVVLGGGVARAGDALLGPLAHEMDAVEWRPGGHSVELRTAELGDLAGAVGAAKNAMEAPA